MTDKPLIWILDEEWAEYDAENAVLREAFPECDIRHSTNDFAEDLGAFGYRADAILAQISIPLQKETIERLTCCKGIAVYGGGYDRVDVAAAHAQGIPVTNVRDYCSEDVADYVIAAIFHSYKQIARHAVGVGGGAWGAGAAEKLPRRIAGQTLFVLGYGAIGKTAAKKAMALGMHVVAHDAYCTEEAIRATGAEPVTRDEGFRRADYATIHVRLTPETQGSVARTDFCAMKPTAVLINASRGAVLNEADLAWALEQGILAGAVLDVLVHEPPAQDDPLVRCKNAVITPHISYLSEDSLQELKTRTARNAVQMLRGERPGDLVNG